MALVNKPTTQPGLSWLLVLALVIVSLVSLPACNQAHNSSSASLKAAIVDQLYVLSTKPGFYPADDPRALAKIVPSSYIFGGKVR